MRLSSRKSKRVADCSRSHDADQIVQARKGLQTSPPCHWSTLRVSALEAAMHKRAIGAAALLILASPAVRAVYLDPHGMGQVLVYPYYTTNAGQATLITVVNTTADGKAVKIRFHEGFNGRNVLDVNIYLSPYDVWA